MKQIFLSLFAAILGAAVGRYFQNLFQTNPAQLVLYLTAIAISGLVVIVKCLIDIAAALEKQNANQASNANTKKVTG